MADSKKTDEKRALRAEYRMTGADGKDYIRTLYIIKITDDETLQYYMGILAGGFEAIQGFTLDGSQVFVMQKLELAKVQTPAIDKPEV